MKITVNRYLSDDDATLSKVSIDGVFECYGLEDEYRKEKVVGETRIPEGVYRVVLRLEGGFHGRYSKRFPDFHNGMLELLEVPDFEYVLIHCGNTDEDTAGCLLLGTTAQETEGDKAVWASAKAYTKFYNKVIDDCWADALWIEYIDNDRSEP